MANLIASRCLSLIRSALLNKIYLEDDVRLMYLAACRELGYAVNTYVLADPRGQLRDVVLQVESAKRNGRNWWSITAPDGKSGTRELNLQEWCDFGHCEDGDDRLELVEELLGLLLEKNRLASVLDLSPLRPGFAIFCRAFQLLNDADDQAVYSVFETDGRASKPDQVWSLILASRYGVLDRGFHCLEVPLGDRLVLENAFSLVRVGPRQWRDLPNLVSFLDEHLISGGFALFEDLFHENNEVELEAAQAVFPGLRHACLELACWRKP